MELKMYQSGKTIDGNPVFAGVFRFIGTHGLPLEIVLSEFQKKGWVIEWTDYISDALKDGANFKNIKARISVAVGDVYGTKYREQVQLRMNKIMN